MLVRYVESELVTVYKCACDAPKYQFEVSEAFPWPRYERNGQETISMTQRAEQERAFLHPRYLKESFGRFLGRVVKLRNKTLAPWPDVNLGALQQAGEQGSAADDNKVSSDRPIASTEDHVGSDDKQVPKRARCAERSQLRVVHHIVCVCRNV